MNHDNGHERVDAGGRNDLVSRTLFILSKLVNQVDENVTDENQDVALACFTKLFSQVPLSEHSDILEFTVKLLTNQPKGEGAVNSAMQCKICETLSKLVVGGDSGIKEKYGKWKEIVTNVLSSDVVNTFLSVSQMLSFKENNEEMRNKKIIAGFNLIVTIIDSNVRVKDSFHSTFSMKALKAIFEPHQNLPSQIADVLLDLLTVSNKPNTEVSQRVIHIEDLTPILVDLIPNFDDMGQRVLSESLCVMCVSRQQNRLICSRVGLLTNVLKLLQQSSRAQLSMLIKKSLINIVGVVGCLSITALQLKLLIGLFHHAPQSDLADRLVQSLERMASQSSQYHMQQQPKHFVDLYDVYKQTSIQCPRIQRYNGKGVSIHTWICLDFSLPNPVEHRTTKIRHVLYSFLNARGEGFEAFFTEDGFLVLAVHTKKEFLTTTITSEPFNDQEWHGLTIIHTKKLLGKATVHVYVDGTEIHTAPLQYPTLNREITFSSIGSGVKSNDNFNYQIHPPLNFEGSVTSSQHNSSVPHPGCIAAGQQNQVWGIPSSIKGQMSSFILFNESLPLQKIQEFSTLGPNFQQLFTPKELLPEIYHNDTASLLSSVVFYFNAKAAYGDEIMDLNNSFKDKLFPLKNLVGRICKVCTIQEAIQSLGGLPVLFPLLEQACFKTKTNVSRNEHVSFEITHTQSKVDNNGDNHSGDNSSNSSATNGDVEGRDSANGPTNINCVDGREKRPIFSALPVSYTPKKVAFSQYDKSDPAAWSISVDEELNSVQVVSGHVSEQQSFGHECVDTGTDITVASARSTTFLEGGRMQTTTSHENFQQRNGDSFIVLGTPPQRIHSSENALSDWTIVDPAIPRTRSETFKRWVKRDTHDLNGVVHFIALMRYMIGSRNQANVTPLDVQGVRVISLLLHSCDPGLLNVGFLNSVDQLVESLLGVKDEKLQAVFQHIVFDFEIWSKADYTTQIAYIQLLHTYMKDDPAYFTGLFKLDYFLQIVKQYYCKNDGSSVSGKKTTHLSQSNERDLRKALLGLTFFMLKESLTTSNMNYIINFISAVSRNEHLDELLDLLDSAVKSGSPSFLTTLAESGSNILYRWLIHDITNATRVKLLNIVIYLLQHAAISDAGRKKLLLKSGLVDGVGELLCKQDIDRDVIVHVLKLSLSIDRSWDLKTDIYTDFCIVLTVFRMVQYQARPVKLEVAIKVRNSLKLSDTSAMRCADEVGWYEPIWKLIITDNCLPCDIDVMEAELVQVVIEIIYIVMWSGIIGSDMAAWTKRSEPLSCLHQIAARGSFIVPVLSIERQLYELCLEASVHAINHSTQPYAVDTQNAVQLLRIIEEFLTSTEISNEDSLKWSTKLLNNIFVLLDALSAWDDSTEGGNEWTEVLQIVERILYHSFRQTNALLLENSIKKLSQLLHKRAVTDEDEASFQIYNMDKVLRILQAHGLQRDSLLSVLLNRFERFCSVYIAKNLIPNLPSLRPSTFKQEFPLYMESEEYINFITEMRGVAESFRKKSSPSKSSSRNYDKLWLESLNAVTSSTHQRQLNLENSLENVSKVIYCEFDERRNNEMNSLTENKKNYRQKIAITKQLWQYQKRFLASERGAWTAGNSSEQHFRLSNTENCNRMRLKLTQNLNYNPHTDAARQRDITNVPDAQVPTETVNVPVSPVDSEKVIFSDEEVMSPNEDEEDDEKENKENKEADASHFYNLEAFDQVEGSCIYSSSCHLVTLMDFVPGRIELTSKHVCFYDENENEADTTSSFDFKFSLQELREVYSRRYNLRKSAAEFFLLDRTSYFLNFPSEKEKDTFYRKLTGQRPKNLYYSGIQNPSRLLRVSKLTSKWVDREISNFEYLMQLNTISGRTYNDLAQYPVFPWVINDFKSSRLDLEDESIYRDLSKPCGSLNPVKAEEIKKRYDSFIDVSGMTQKSHYFTHYSNPGGILHYLVRVEPFTSLHIRLQSGKFDCADRQFYSIATTWSTVYNGGDVKELIPEFFCFPEFLLNSNNFNLGTLQRNGQSVHDVMLPPWAKDPYTFVDIHRKALESEYVSTNLHLWIDLIFGCRQRGKAAEKALNVFSHYSYEGAVDLDKIEDPIMREATEGMINNFGQTPTQLLKKPHPKRKTLQEMDAEKQKVLDNVKDARFSLIEILHMNTPVVFIAACKPRPKSILYHAVPDSMVTVHSNGLFGIHQWLPYADAKSNSFSFTMDVLLASTSSHHQRLLPGCMSPAVEYSSKLFAFTADGHLMLSCGYWDNSIRLVNTDRGKDKLKSCVTYHNDVVTCISLDADGSQLISGSADLTCAVWKIEQTNGFSSGLLRQPIQVLYGHMACVTAVAMHGDVDLAVSGAKDGTCLVHTIRKGIFMHTLKPFHPNKKTECGSILQIKLSEQGRIVVLSNVEKLATPHHFITMYSINGALLSNIALDVVVYDMCITSEHLVLGSMNETLQIRDIRDLSHMIISKQVRAPIYTVAASHNGSHIFIGRGDGNIMVMCPFKDS